jgi:hypothetical protein
MNGTLSDDIRIWFPVLSVTSGGGYIWVLGGAVCRLGHCYYSIAKLNASSGALESRFDYQLPSHRSFASLVFDGNNIWAGEGDRITEIRPDDDGRMSTEVPMDINLYPRTMIFDGTFMWVASIEHVTRIPITIHLSGKSPTAFAEDGEDIWVGSNSEDYYSLSVGKHLASTGEQVQLLEIPYRYYHHSQALTCAHSDIWVALWPDNTSGGEVLEVSSKDGKVLNHFDMWLTNPSGIAYDNNRYIWVGTGTGVIRLRESDCEPAGTFLDGMPITDILYDDSHIWVIGGDYNDSDRLIKLDPIDGSRLATYPLGLWARHLVYDENNHSFWVLGSGDGGDTVLILQQISAEDGTIIPPAIPVPEGDSLAYGGTHVWVSSPWDDTVIRIDPSNPANQVNYAVCDWPSALLYTRAGQGIWVACQADGLIQKLSANPELSGLSTLEPASLPPVTLGDDARRLYLPVIMKEGIPAPAGAEPRQTPGVTGAPVPVTPTATATMTPIPILIPTPTAASP